MKEVRLGNLGDVTDRVTRTAVSSLVLSKANSEGIAEKIPNEH